MNTKITAQYRLFDRDHRLEIDLDLSHEPDVDQAKEIIMDKMHEATDQDGNPIKAEQVDEKVFITIQFLEILVEHRKKMICYKWRRATLKNSVTKHVECSNYGAFIMTKTIM